MNKLFVFPGFGSQLVGMFDALPQDARYARLVDAAEARSGLDIGKIVSEGPESALNDVRVAYPAITILDEIWGSYLSEKDIVPAAVCGYGIGEIAALSVAGVISHGAAVTLAHVIAQTFVHTTADSDGVMAVVVGLTAEEVQNVLADSSHVWISAINSPRQVAISGVESAVLALEPALESAGARRVMRMRVPGALHSPLMAQAQEQIAAFLDRAEFNDATIPFISCVDGSMSEDGIEIKKMIIESITKPIDFQRAVSSAIDQLSCKVALECGAGSLLCGHLAQSPISAIPVSQYADRTGIEQLKGRLEAIESRLSAAESEQSEDVEPHEEPRTDSPEA